MPFYTGDTATFGSISGAASAITVTLDGNYSVGHLVFNSSASSYTIALGSGGALSIGATSSADITVLAGIHTIAVPVAFAVSLNVNISANSGITLNNSLSFPPAASYPYATTLTKTGGGTLTLSGSISTGYASTFNASGGNTVFSTDPTSGLVLNVNGGGTVVQFTAATRGGYQARNAASLNLSSGAIATILSPSNQVNRTVLDLGSLSIDSTSNLDLGSNDAVIQNANASTAVATLASITALVKQGYNAGKWNGSGGIISTAAAANTNHLTAIGVIVNDNGNGIPIYSSFDGTSDANPDTDVLLKYTYYGDANLDGHVDGSDYSRIDNGFLNHLTGWANGDFNYDGVIDGSDYTLIDNAFNTQGASLGNGTTTAVIATPTAQLAAVPEPSTLAVLFLAGAILCRRRNRFISVSSAGGEEEDHGLTQ
jgi:hypothetical protein